MADLKLLPPDATCNARLHRGTGYCDLAAGTGTNHPGTGRCRLHGGVTGKRQDGVDGPVDQMRAIGLGTIIDLAETMTHDDQEYLMEVGNNALVVTRAKILARLQNSELSPKEMTDLSMALQRIDGILAKYPDEEDPDRGANTPSAEDEELARLIALEAEVGA